MSLSTKIEPYESKQNKESKKIPTMVNHPHFIKKRERAMDLLKRAPLPDKFKNKK
jgi:hypothetical protein